MSGTDLILGIALLVLAFWGGIRIGYWYRGFVILKMLAKTLTAQAEKHQQLADKLNSTDTSEMLAGIKAAAAQLDLTLLRHEQIDSQHFFYTVDTGLFVAQGNTLDQAALNYSKNSTRIGCVADPTGDSYFIVDGKITQQLPAAK